MANNYNQQNLLALYSPQLNAIYKSQRFFQSVFDYSFGEKLDALWEALNASGWLRKYGKRNGRTRISDKKQLAEVLQDLLEYRDLRKETLDSITPNEAAKLSLISAYKSTEVGLRKALDIAKPTIECVTSFMSHIFACVPVVTNKFCKYLRKTYAHVGCAFSTFNRKFLDALLDFYEKHKELATTFMAANVELGLKLIAEALNIDISPTLEEYIRQILTAYIVIELSKFAEKLYDYAKHAERR